MLLIVVLLLIAGLLLLFCFIYCRVRCGNRTAHAKALQEKAIFSDHGRSRILIKMGNNTIIKTTGFADDELFFCNN